MASQGKYELLCLENPLLDIQGVGYVNWLFYTTPEKGAAGRWNNTRRVRGEIDADHELVEMINFSRSMA